MTLARCLLALDAAGASLSVALWADGQLCAERFEAMTRGQSEKLVPMAQELLSHSKRGFGDLEAVAVTLGPGGFTGLRIALAAAQGFAKAWRLPILGISSFHAHAFLAEADELHGRQLVVVLDGKRQEFFTQVFDGAREVRGEAFAATPADLAQRLEKRPLLLLGDASEQVAPSLRAAGHDLLIGAAAGPLRAGGLAKLAAMLDLPPADAPPPLPLYLRAPDTTTPKAKS